MKMLGAQQKKLVSFMLKNYVDHDTHRFFSLSFYRYYLKMTVRIREYPPEEDPNLLGDTLEYSAVHLRNAKLGDRDPQRPTIHHVDRNPLAGTSTVMMPFSFNYHSARLKTNLPQNYGTPPQKIPTFICT